MTTATLRSYGSMLSEMPSLRAAALVLTALAASLLHLGTFFLVLVGLVTMESVFAGRRSSKRAAAATLRSSLPAIALFLLATAFSLYLPPLRDAVLVFGKTAFSLVTLGGSFLIFLVKWSFVRLAVARIVSPSVRVARAKASASDLRVRLTVGVTAAAAIALLLSPFMLQQGMTNVLEIFVREFLTWNI